MSIILETAAIAAWLTRLVQIPSVGPENAGARSGSSSEARLAAQLAEWFTSLGAEVTTEDVYPERPNVYAVWRANSDRWLGVDIHMDTVSVETMLGDPFDGRIEDGRVWGRGAVDTKATLAILLAQLEALRDSSQHLDFNLLICASSAEETGAQGAAVFANWVRRQGIALEGLIVAEPTLCAPVYGHRGSVGIAIEIEGVAVHSSKPERGKNAISAAASVIIALDKEYARLAALPPTPVGTATMAVTLINGGQAFNIIPDRCRLSVDRRLVVGEDPQTVAVQVEALSRAACPLPLHFTTSHRLNAFYQPPTAPLIGQLAEWAGTTPTVAPFGTNAWAYNGLAESVVIFGPGSIDQAHGEVEWVTLDELDKAATVYARWWGISG